MKTNYYLVLSTSTMILPVIISYKNKNKNLALSTFVTLLSSLNYWRNPCLGFARNLDLITSKICVLFYSYYGCSNIKGMYKLAGFGNLYMLYYFYNKSHVKYYEKNESWVVYHFCFHILTTYSQLYVLYWL
jgi:hypothetical protein